MTKLIYVTHPKSKINKHTLPQHWGLSAEGIKEAQRFSENNIWQNIDILFSSIEPKAIILADLVSEKYKINHFVDARLGEADRTAKPFLSLGEYMDAVENAYENHDEKIHGWESHASMFQRNKQSIDEILSQYENKTIAVIGHGGAGTCVKCYLANLALTFKEDPKQTGCYFIADVEKRQLIKDWTKY